MADYQTITLADARTALAQRLQDPTFVHWTADELTIYLHEAIRTWSAYTSPFRATGVFSTTYLEPFYDINDELGDLRSFTVTDQDLVNEIEYHLLEPPSGAGAWVGSSQFTLTNLVSAIQRRRDQFLLQTGAVVTQQALTISPPPQGRVNMPTNVLQVTRLAWTSADAITTPIRRDDEWGSNHYRFNWVQNPAPVPTTWSVAAISPLVLQLIPAPSDQGVMNLTGVVQGAVLNPATPVLLGIPDDWSWVVKFGALADLLSQDGLAFDPERASYCTARWEQGLQMARKAGVILTARVNNKVARIGALTDLDRYTPSWTQTIGIPTMIATAGQNLIACSPVPSDQHDGSGPPAITLDVVSNAPWPATDADYLPIAADQIEPILDYAQHLAMFKEGTGQLQQSQGLLDGFLNWCGVTVIDQAAQQPNRDKLLPQTQLDMRKVVPEETLPVATTL